MFHAGVCCVAVSVPCSFVLTCWELVSRLSCVLCFLVLCYLPKCVLVDIRIDGEIGAVGLVQDLQ